MPILPENFWIGAIGTFLFGVIGLVLQIGGFKIFDWILPKVDFQEELVKGNLAVAIVIAGFFLGIAHMVASVVH